MTDSVNEEQMLEAARHCYRRLKTGKGDPKQLVPKIRGYLLAADATADVLSFSGSRSAESIEQDLRRYESEATPSPQR